MNNLPVSCISVNFLISRVGMRVLRSTEAGWLNSVSSSSSNRCDNLNRIPPFPKSCNVVKLSAVGKDLEIYNKILFKKEQSAGALLEQSTTSLLQNPRYILGNENLESQHSYYRYANTGTTAMSYSTHLSSLLQVSVFASPAAFSSSVFAFTDTRGYKRREEGYRKQGAIREEINKGHRNGLVGYDCTWLCLRFLLFLPFLVFMFQPRRGFPHRSLLCHARDFALRISK